MKRLRLELIAAIAAILLGLGCLAYSQGPNNGPPPFTAVAIFFPSNVTPTDCSGSIAVGGTAQPLITAQTTLHSFMVANMSNGDELMLSITGTAAASGVSSYPLLPLTTTGQGTFVAPFGLGTNHAVSIVGPNTSDPFTCTWW